MDREAKIARAKEEFERCVINFRGAITARWRGKNSILTTEALDESLKISAREMNLAHEYLNQARFGKLEAFAPGDLIFDPVLKRTGTVVVENDELYIDWPEVPLDLKDHDHPSPKTAAVKPLLDALASRSHEKSRVLLKRALADRSLSGRETFTVVTPA